MAVYVVEGIFLLETDAEDPRSARYKAREILANKDTRIYIIDVREKKEEKTEEWANE